MAQRLLLLDGKASKWKGGTTSHTASAPFCVRGHSSFPLFPLSALSVPGIRCPRKMGRAEVLSEHLLHLFYSQVSTEHDNSSATFLVSQRGSSRSAHFIIKSIFGLC